jgi:hypothetical protein
VGSLGLTGIVSGATGLGDCIVYVRGFGRLDSLCLELGISWNHSFRTYANIPR